MFHHYVLEQVAAQRVAELRREAEADRLRRPRPPRPARSRSLLARALGRTAGLIPGRPARAGPRPEPGPGPEPAALPAAGAGEGSRSRALP